MEKRTKEIWTGTVVLGLGLLSWPLKVTHLFFPPLLCETYTTSKLFIFGALKSSEIFFILGYQV